MPFAQVSQVKVEKKQNQQKLPKSLNVLKFDDIPTLQPKKGFVPNKLQTLQAWATGNYLNVYGYYAKCWKRLIFIDFCMRNLSWTRHNPDEWYWFLQVSGNLTISKANSSFKIWILSVFSQIRFYMSAHMPDSHHTGCCVKLCLMQSSYTKPLC